MPSNETSKQAVLAGRRIAFLALNTVAVDLATRQVISLPVAGLPVIRQWYVVHCSRATVRSASAVIDVVARLQRTRGIRAATFLAPTGNSMHVHASGW